MTNLKLQIKLEDNISKKARVKVSDTGVQIWWSNRNDVAGGGTLKVYSDGDESWSHIDAGWFRPHPGNVAGWKSEHADDIAKIHKILADFTLTD